MNRASAALLGLSHRIAYATAITGAVWLFYAVPFGGPLADSSMRLLKLADLPIAAASQALPCNARGVDMWFRVDPGETVCPHYTTTSESLGSHLRTGIPAYVLLFYLPNLFIAVRGRWRTRRGPAHRLKP